MDKQTKQFRAAAVAVGIPSKVLEAVAPAERAKSVSVSTHLFGRTPSAGEVGRWAFSISKPDYSEELFVTTGAYAPCCKHAKEKARELGARFVYLIR